MYGPSLGPTGNGNMFIAASSMFVFADSADCGACYEITGPTGASVIVTVVDQCTDGGVCDTTFPHLDLSPEAFNVIADTSVAGVTSTNARRVACPVTGGVKLAIGGNYFSATNWEILIFNTRLPITAVTVSYGGKTFSLTRQTYNYWLYNGAVVTWPAVIAVTDVNGKVVTFQPLTFTSGMIVEAANSAQFPIPTPFSGAPTKCDTPSTISSDGWIYQDSLSQQYNSIDYINVFQWLDYSYGASVNWAWPTNPYQGSYCLKAVLSGYGGVQIGQSYSFAWSGLFTSFQFAIRGDASFNSIAFSLKGYKSVPISVTTSWQVITLNLATDLLAPPTIGGQVPLLWANTLGATAPTLYLDNIRFVPAASSTSGTPSSSPTTTQPTTKAPTTAPTTAPKAPTTAPTTAATKAPTTAAAKATTSPTKAPAVAAPTTSPTKAPAVPTTSPTKAPAAAAPTTPPAPGVSGACSGVFVNQTVVGSWRDTYVHNIYSLTITNSRPTTANNIVLSIVPATGGTIEQSWNLNPTSGGGVTGLYVIPYILESKQTYTGSGYITGSAAATVTVSVCT